MSALASVADGLSGAAGGVVALVVTYPLMTLSTNQAVSRSPSVATKLGAQEEGPSTPPPPPPPPPPRPTWIEKLKTLLRLYSGLGPAIAGTALSQGVYFYLYSRLRDAALSIQKELTVGSSLLVAALAGMGNVLLTNPVWVVVTRMQVAAAQRRTTAAAAGQSSARPGAVDLEPQPADERDPEAGPQRGQGGAGAAAAPHKPGRVTTWGICRDLYRESGVLGFWKGLVPSLVMVANPTIQYVLYEALQRRLKRWKRRAARVTGAVPGAATAAEIFATSAVAKAGATIVTYPLLVVKSRLQAASRPAAGRPLPSDHYHGTADAVLKILSQEGIGAFFKGIRVKLVQSVLAAALLFLVKEEISAAIRTALGVAPVQ